jgi:prophage antirepressor-like protein
MSNMILFQKPEFGRVRCFVIDGEPWFVAKDVCECLEIGNPTQAAMRLDSDEKSTLSLNEGGPDRNIVNECGVYNLVLGSRKQEAKAFKRWIVHEVIPQIRKTGNYSVNQDIKPMSDGELIARALIAANSTIERIEKEREAEKRFYSSDRSNGTGTR